MTTILRVKISDQKIQPLETHDVDRSTKGQRIRPITQEPSAGFLSSAWQFTKVALLVAAVITLPGLAAAQAASQPSEQECKDGVCSGRTITPASDTDLSSVSASGRTNLAAKPVVLPATYEEEPIYSLGAKFFSSDFARTPFGLQPSLGIVYVSRDPETDVPYISDMSGFTAPVQAGMNPEDGRSYVFMQVENWKTKKVSMLVLHDTDDSSARWKISNVDGFKSSDLQDRDFLRIMELLTGRVTPLPLGRYLDEEDAKAYFKLHKFTAARSFIREA